MLPVMVNRLATEHSPYLLQHATNPVDWYPWTPEAFERARREHKPIFLSIGYSTCHWCHVMAHESFENPDIADMLNRFFVSIKVDREERPDVDRVYMSFVQATTGSGGWPMSVWLTPDLKPFYGGTYFPPTSGWGRPGFLDVLGEISRMWERGSQEVQASADDIVRQLAGLRGPGNRRADGRVVGDVASLQDGVEDMARAFDRRHGGFGGAPKFPRPAELLFLLREHARTGELRARDMVAETVRAMALGGMRDHVGGGFHRYSVDAEWRVPHFEKMLYDQAQIVLACLETAQATGDPFYTSVAEDTLQYVQRDLTHPAGGFYSAEDADSLPPEDAGDPTAHKSEGAFYLWSEAEVRALLGDIADLTCLRFGIRPAGNAPLDPHGDFRGKNLLYTAQTIEEVAETSGLSPETVVEHLGHARKRLFDARATRPRPHLDDKILTSWNGLMIAAFARAARVVGWAAGTDAAAHARAASYQASARRAAAFIRDTLWRADTRTLLRRFRDDDAAIEGYCEDYAHLVWGLLELFQSDGDPAWLEWAVDLQRRQDEWFWDEEEGGWFSTSGRDPSVLLRLKEDYDGAEPSAGSVATLNLLVLGHLTGEADARARVERALARFGGSLGRLARAVPLMTAALATYHAGVTQIVVVGSREDPRTQALLAEVVGAYRPFAIVVPVDGSADTRSRLASVAPFVGPLTTTGEPTVFVCRDFVCHEPVTNVEGLRRVLA